MPDRETGNFNGLNFVKVLFMQHRHFDKVCLGSRGRFSFELCQSIVMLFKTLTKWMLAYFVKVLFMRISTLTKFFSVAESVSLRTLSKWVLAYFVKVMFMRISTLTK